VSELGVDLIQDLLAIEGTQSSQILGDRFTEFDSEHNSGVDPDFRSQEKLLLPHCSEIPGKRIPSELRGADTPASSMSRDPAIDSISQFALSRFAPI
jgi:hypothetical protein